MSSEVVQLRPLGTPKTLGEAIRRGDTPEAIEASVRGFLANRFTPFYLREVSGVQALWRAITGDAHPDMFTRDILARKAANADVSEETPELDKALEGFKKADDYARSLL